MEAKYLIGLTMFLLLAIALISYASFTPTTGMTLILGDQNITQDYNGATDFNELDDTPANYIGSGSQCVAVNAGETGLEFIVCAAGLPDTTLDVNTNALFNFLGKSYDWNKDQNFLSSNIFDLNLGKDSFSVNGTDFNVFDLNTSVLNECSGDANHVLTSNNLCQFIGGYGSGGSGGVGDGNFYSIPDHNILFAKISDVNENFLLIADSNDFGRLFYETINDWNTAILYSVDWNSLGITDDVNSWIYSLTFGSNDFNNSYVSWIDGNKTYYTQIDLNTLFGANIDKMLYDVGDPHFDNVTIDNLSVNGNASFVGNIITGTAKFLMDLIPNDDDQENLGATNYRWKNLYLSRNAFIDGNVFIDQNLNVDGNATIECVFFEDGTNLCTYNLVTDTNFQTFADFNKTYLTQLDGNLWYPKIEDVNKWINSLTWDSSDFNTVYLGGGTSDGNFYSIQDFNKLYYQQSDANNVFVKLSDVNSGIGRFAGFTTSTYDGNVYYDDGSRYYGYVALHKICASIYLNAHACTTDEIILTIADGNIAGFTEDAWIQEGAPGYLANANDCVGWTNNSASGYFGAFFLLNATKGGYGSLGGCSGSKYFACCN